MTDQNYQREIYISRINRVIDYIETNIEKSMSLRELAAIACFSPFHFHRIFSAFTGETVNQFINRIRLERAAMQLLANKRKSITEISYDYGYGSPATFARAFQKTYGMSASQWRDGGYLSYRKNCKTDRKIRQTNRKAGKIDNDAFSYVASRKSGDQSVTKPKSTLDRSTRMKKVSSLTTDVKVENLADMHVAYVRHVGPYKGDAELFTNLWKRLMRWAGPRGLMDQEDMKCLCVYHDNPEITDETKLRTSVCLTVPDDTDVDGEICAMDLEGGRYAVGHFEIDVDQYEDAWDFMFGSWLPDSGYQPADRPAFEMCFNDPDKHPQKKHIIDICIPVEPL